MKIFGLLLILLLPVRYFAQDTIYARQVVAKLSSPEFHGRGFTNNGDKIAAEYLKNELDSNKVKAFDGNYFQNFDFSINTLPSKLKVKLDDKELIPGSDYVVSNSSGKCSGNFSLLIIDSINVRNQINKDLSKTFIVIDSKDFESKKQKDIFLGLKYGNILKAVGVVDISNSKPQQGQSQEAMNFVSIDISKEKFDASAKTISISFKNKFYKKYTSQNVIGYVEGEVDTFIMFGGHYDHLGNMGPTVYFPGANDNASGCAMILNLARHYGNLDYKPHYSMMFVFFSAEEVGILGSKYFSENPPVPLSKIKFFFNLDLVGTGEEGIKVVNGSVLKKEFETLVNINEKNNYLAKVSPRGEAMNSDHYYIYNKGVKSVFIYTLGGYSEYHNIYDIESTLKLTEFADLFKLIRDFADIYR